MKSDNQTKPTSRDIEEFIAGLPENQQADSRALTQMMQEVSGELPVLWGSRIVGFGSYHYKYRSGREGDWMRIGFAPGTGKFSLYLTYDAEKLTSKIENLGKYKTGKGCVYINKLADVDSEKLKTLIKIAYASEAPYQ
jgi:hypothetical protein